MIEKEITELYKKTRKQLAALMDDMTFANFYRALQSGKRSYALKNTNVRRSIDEDWVNAIKQAIPHIDNIVNNPRKYMKRETEVVPVEKARIVDSESVKHLAAHTNLIHSVDNGFVRPNKILTAYNEESLELYENRFVCTLIVKVSQFIDRRYYLLGSGGNEFSSGIELSGGFEQAGENTDYSMNMTVHQGADYFDGGISEKVYEDLYMIRKYVNSFRYSPFVKEMLSYGAVRPPIIKTNLLSKEPNYRACVKLWDFVETYDKAGYKIEIDDFTPEIDRDLVDDFDAVGLMLYVALKNKMGDYDKRRRAMEKCTKKVIKPLIERSESDAEQLVTPPLGSLGLRGMLSDDAKRDSDNAIKEVLLRALRKEQVKREIEQEEEKRREREIMDVVQRALTHEKQRREQEKKQFEQKLRQTLGAAIRIEQAKAKKEAREREKLEAKAENAIRRELYRFKQDERQKAAQLRREQAENEQLMNAVISDMLRLEEQREYFRASPLIVDGRENVPVPLPYDASRDCLPVTQEYLSQQARQDYRFTVLSDEDWIQLKTEFAEQLPRRRVGAQKVEDALSRAIASFRRKQRKEQRLAEQEREREERQRQQSERQQSESADNERFEREAAEIERAESERRAEREQAARDTAEREQAARDTAEREQAARDTAEREQAESGMTKGQEREQDESDKSKEQQGVAEKSGGRGAEDDEKRKRSLVPADEEKRSFWRWLFDKIFFWRKRK